MEIFIFFMQKLFLMFNINKLGPCMFKNEAYILSKILKTKQNFQFSPQIQNLYHFTCETSTVMFLRERFNYSFFSTAHILAKKLR